MNTKLKNVLINAGLMSISVVITIIAAEWGYRIFLRNQKWKLPANYSYHITSSVHIRFHDKYGEEPKPNSNCFMTYIHNGAVRGGTSVFISNADGLDGKTTLADYNKADKKVLVFGDSFTHWNQSGDTWPDLMQQELNKKPGNNVAVLNYARGAYGVLQMLDLAADKIEELKPDLVVIAAIGDDFSRTRWWGKEENKDSITRWMLSVRKDIFIDLNSAGDFSLVLPQATKEWYKRQMKNPDPNDPVLKKANALYAKLKQETDAKRKQVPLTKWDHSFLYSRIKTGSPYKSQLGFGVPRTFITDFRQDAQAMESIKRINGAGVPVRLVYLPVIEDFKAKAMVNTPEPIPGQHTKLMASLEKMLNTPFYHPEKEYTGPLPPQINLHPYNEHPNRAGLELYARIITPLAEKALTTIKQQKLLANSTVSAHKR